MSIELKPGKYIVAVSGGVDSMVLLDLVAKKKNVELVVAHFDHGIHEKSGNYCDFVAKEVEKLGLQFVSQQGNLGAGTSEAEARKVRYEFLHTVKEQHKADAILTAHHQDDLIETIIINLLRGTGRKGLSSLKSTDDIKRPLLEYTKRQIADYAQSQGVKWREDPTNSDISYLRNYVRLKIAPRLSRPQIDQLITLSYKQNKDSEIIENIVATLSQQQVIRNYAESKSDVIATKSQIDRKLFISLPHNVAKEVLAELLRSAELPFDSKMLEKLVVFTKTARQKKKISITKKAYLVIDGDHIKLNLL